MPNKLIIMPPTYRRNKDKDMIPAIERYDGILYRVLRKNINPNNIPDSLVLTEGMKLIWGNTEIPFQEPKGSDWKKLIPPKRTKKIIIENDKFIKKIIDQGNNDEIFVALSKSQRPFLGEVKEYVSKNNMRITYIQGNGIGPYAAHFKKWLNKL